MSLHQDREEDLESLLNKGALWAVTYGDLMSYLMIFFLLMFTFTLKGKSSSKNLEAMQTHFGGKKDSAAIHRMQMKGQEEEVAKEFEKTFQVKVSEQKIQVTLDEKILFDSGKAELKTAVYPALHKFAELVRSMPNEIQIEGHTDNVPIRNAQFKNNFELSMARAYSMLRYLVETEKIPAQRLSAAGYGEFHPVVPNDSPDLRAQNRRIEINLIRAQ